MTETSAKFPDGTRKPFLIKSAGGAASQLQALKTAIYISHLINRPFKFRHYPNSTGGFFPIAISELLYKDEVEDLCRETRGLKPNHDTNPGMIIDEHPLLRRGLNHAKLMMLIRLLRIDSPLRRLRGEISLDYSRKKLDSIPRKIRSVTGGYFPFAHEHTDQSLSLRFEKSGIPNPYKSSESTRDSFRIVIHYRIGEKRTTYSHPGLMGDGILDPSSIKDLLENLPDVDVSRTEIIVVSDEPDEAHKLLLSAGIKAVSPESKGNLWVDMQIMSSADILICPWSTVSQFVASVLVRAGKVVYYPSATSRGLNPTWSLPGVNRYSAKYLPKGHPIYKSIFSLDSDAHVIYQKPNGV